MTDEQLRQFAASVESLSDAIRAFSAHANRSDWDGPVEAFDAEARRLVIGFLIEVQQTRKVCGEEVAEGLLQAAGFDADAAVEALQTADVIGGALNRLVTELHDL